MNAPATNSPPSAAPPSTGQGTRNRLRKGAREAKVANDPATALWLEALGSGQPQVFCARGGSMWPSIPDGTRVELEALEKPPALLDVVLVTSTDGAFFLHRVRGLDAAGRFFLLGDRCSRPDGWFPLGQMVAQARRMDRGAGWEPIPPPVPLPTLWQRAWRRLRGLR